jgi:hypothetical protein
LERKLTYASDFQLDNQYVRESELRLGDYKILSWQWYRMGKFITPDPYIIKIFEAYYRLVSGRADATYIVISTPLVDNDEILQGNFWPSSLKPLAMKSNQNWKA